MPLFTHIRWDEWIPSFDGSAIGSISLSPRGAWQMPSDASADLWLREVEELERTMKRGE